jgi:hypothetical protein
VLCQHFTGCPAGTLFRAGIVVGVTGKALAQQPSVPARASDAVTATSPASDQPWPPGRPDLGRKTQEERHAMRGSTGLLAHEHSGGPGSVNAAARRVSNPGGQ